MSAVIDIRNFSITYAGEKAPVPAVRKINLSLCEGRILGLVGESGSGKSSLANAMLSILPKSSRVDGKIFLNGQDLYALSAKEQRSLRGKAVATVSQDPFTALNPVTTIGRQLEEFQHRLARTRAEKRQAARDMLIRVGISDADLRMKQYPHQLSGGLRQRVAIAATLLVRPKLLIADEPTTALDATTEAEVIEIIRSMRGEVDGSIVFVTHDMGLVSRLCDDVAVMYAGDLVESGPVADVMKRPQHPYTRALLACDPARIKERSRSLPTIEGTVPRPTALPPGCVFAPRCAEAIVRCQSEKPALVVSGPSHVACHLRSAANALA